MTVVTLPYRTQLAAGKAEDVGMILSDFDAVVGGVNGGLDNGNFAPGAAIPLNKMGITGTPDGTKFLKDTGAWEALPTGTNLTYLKKTTVKDVVNTTTLTDLLNGEITLPANFLINNSFFWFHASGDWLNNTGGNQTFGFYVSLGGGNIWGNTSGDTVPSSANRRAWVMKGLIMGIDSTHICAHFLFHISKGAALATTGVGPLSTTTAAGPLDNIPGDQNNQTVTLSNPIPLQLNVQWTGASSTRSWRLTRFIGFGHP